MAAAATAVAAADPVRYRVGLANRDHHEARIEVTFSDLPDRPLEVRMSRSSPGRYALHEFAKNVYAVSARAGSGHELSIERASPHQWNVSGHDGTVVFAYTLYGDRCDGTYSAIDNTHAHLNAPASFVWARGLEQRAAEVSFELPEGWRVATQLEALPNGRGFRAPDFQYLMDSPIEAGTFELFEWEVPGPEQEALKIRIALHHQGSDHEAEQYVELAKAVVREQIAIFGEAPGFDFGEYTFLADYLPYASGDGMEHRNSTVLTSTRPLSTGMISNLTTLSHELLHAWNVERIRPSSLEPFDFERANMSGELWFGEGFTSYYDDLVLKRTGAISLERFVEVLSDNVSLVLNAPGPKLRSPIQMSQLAPFVDAATSNDPTNVVNTYVSYYSYGAFLGLLLDLELRTRFGRSLDDLMAAAWRELGRAERSYDHDDLERLLAAIAGDRVWARDFFARYVRRGSMPDLSPLLEPAGLLLRPRRPGHAWLGAPRLERGEGGLRVRGATRVQTPLYRAGVDRGDVLLRFDGRKLESPVDLSERLDERQPGDRVDLVFEKRGERRQVEMQLGEDPALEVVPFERVGRSVAPEMEHFRQQWLASRASGAQ